jgi:hypothetical protein
MKEEARTNEPTRISRRRFLMLIGGAVGASVLCCGGLATLGLRQPAIEYAKSSCGKENMNDRILVAYASRAGSTGESLQTRTGTVCGQSNGRAGLSIPKHR